MTIDRLRHRLDCSSAEVWRVQVLVAEYTDTFVNCGVGVSESRQVPRRKEMRDRIDSRLAVY